jgi:hypothetical protein
MFQRDLNFIKTLIPPSLVSATVIAGGAAIGPHTSEDIDVYVLVEDEVEDAVELLNQRLDAVHGRTAHVNPADDDCYDGNAQGMSGITLVADISPYGGTKNIQLIVSTADCITSLLDSFDITAHQWAVGLDNVGHSAETSTLPSQQPRVRHFRTPLATLKRLIKMLQRYGWEVANHPDLGALRKASLKTGEVYTFDQTLRNANFIPDEDIPF